MSNPFTYSIFVDSNQITNIQDVSMSLGRRQVSDPFKAGTVVITGRNISALPAVEIGMPFELSITGGLPFPADVFNGVVADVSFTYGTVPNMDVWTISAEDALAEAGRSVVSASWLAGDGTFDAAEKLVNATDNLSLNLLYFYNDSSTVSAQNLTNVNVLDVLNQLAFTEQAVIASRNINQINWNPRLGFTYDIPFLSFTDGSLTAETMFEYDFQDITFKAQADSFFTKTIIEPEGLNAQDSGTADRVYVRKSYDQTETQAQNLADYVQATLEVSQEAPSFVRVLATSYNNLTNPVTAATQYIFEKIPVEVILRGSRFLCFVEGSTISATPTATYITLFLSSAEARNFFILDSATFGVLNQNRLGF